MHDLIVFMLRVFFFLFFLLKLLLVLLQRESSEGKLNAMSLCMINAGGDFTKEEASEAIKGNVERTRRELLRLVLQEKNSTVPRACKDLFWKMSCVVHLFYRKDDGFTSHELMNSAKALLEQPMVLDELLNK